ncbi:MAG: hypothetical protein LBP25_05405 [Tannerellaceae bacterium]|nr:hypothetical protein [Tannerellaceae bacterium]
MDIARFTAQIYAINIYQKVSMRMIFVRYGTGINCPPLHPVDPQSAGTSCRLQSTPFCSADTPAGGER